MTYNEMIAAVLAVCAVVFGIIFQNRRKKYRKLWRYERTRRAKKKLVSPILAGILALGGAGYLVLYPETSQHSYRFVYEEIPEYSDSPYVYVNENVPYFTDEDLTAEEYISFSDLDTLGRCGEANAVLGPELLCDEERGSISSIKPTGWHTVRYDDLIADKYLYNRCHLIAYMLCGENANELNLITGTRYMNVTGMLEWEILVGDYIEETGNHVRYRATPVFLDDELVARGVLMEALSVEDDGEGISFCVYVYNVQPGIQIDYATGESERA